MLRGFIDALIGAGVDLLQIREPDLDDDLLAEVTRAAVAAAAGRTTVIAVNSRVDIAREAGAGGVHLKEADPRPVASIRSEAPNLIVGRSIHDAPVRADEQADYLIAGTIFPTESKPGIASAGLDGLRRIVSHTAVPVLAIGGVTPATVRACLAAGAKGVAAIGPFLPPGTAPESLGPVQAVAAFRAAFAR